MRSTNITRLLLRGRIDPLEYYVCDRYRVVYIENAKVACTAIKQLLYPDVSYDELQQEDFHAALRVRAQPSSPAEAADYLHFSFFRDPAARLLSCYQDKIKRAAAEDTPSYYHDRFHRTVYRVIGGVDVTSADLDFASFATAVARLPDRLRDRHVASQITALGAVCAAEKHFIGKLETLAQDWAALRIQTGLPDLPRLNQAKAAYGGDAIVKPETLRLIERAFAADYSALAYPTS